ALHAQTKSSNRSVCGLAHPAVCVARQLVEPALERRVPVTAFSQRRRRCLADLPLLVLRRLDDRGDEAGLLVPDKLPAGQSSRGGPQSFHPAIPGGLLQLIEDLLDVASGGTAAHQVAFLVGTGRP